MTARSDHNEDRPWTDKNNNKTNEDRPNHHFLLFPSHYQRLHGRIATFDCNLMMTKKTNRQKKTFQAFSPLSPLSYSVGD